MRDAWDDLSHRIYACTSLEQLAELLQLVTHVYQLRRDDPSIPYIAPARRARLVNLAFDTETSLRGDMDELYSWSIAHCCSMVKPIAPFVFARLIRKHRNLIPNVVYLLRHKLPLTSHDLWEFVLDDMYPKLDAQGARDLTGTAARAMQEYFRARLDELAAVAV
jgi:hypothetical protein